MRLEVGSSVLELVRGDITNEEVDVIANAANSALAGGGGVDGAIHRAGGPEIMRELNEKYTGCPTGSAVITGAGRLKAKYVIHAVGPRYSGKPKDEELLAGAYRSSLELAVSHKAESIAFPSISTGVYGYPIEDAARIALRTVMDFLKEKGAPKLIRFILFSESDLAVYEEALRLLHFTP